MLVGERTASLVGGAFELGEPRTVEAKGKEGGVDCGSSGGCSRRGGARGHGLESTFVGRTRELGGSTPRSRERTRAGARAS